LEAFSDNVTSLNIKTQLSTWQKTKRAVFQIIISS
jgi:hypothetical protein